MTDREAIARMRELDAKATPPGWWTNGIYDADEHGLAIIAANTDCGPLPGNPTRGMVAWASEILPENAETCEANAALIVALRNDALRIITQQEAEIERLKAANGILEDGLQEVGDDYPGSSCQEWCQHQIKQARAALENRNG